MADKLIKDTPVLTGNTLEQSDIIPVCMPLDGTIKNVTVENLLQAALIECKSLTNICNCLKNRLEDPNLGKPSNIIINQFYGGTGGSVSHNFVELYNPTNSSVSLDGMALHYCTTKAITKIVLTGSIPSKTSFLIKGGVGSATNPGLATGLSWLDISAKTADMTIENTFSNKMIGFILTSNTTDITIEQLKNVLSISGVIDAVATTDDKGGVPPFVIGSPAQDQSKQKSVRRILFSKTNSNKYDFEIVDYRLKENLKKAPKCVADGAWE